MRMVSFFASRVVTVRVCDGSLATVLNDECETYLWRATCLIYSCSTDVSRPRLEL